MLFEEKNFDSYFKFYIKFYFIFVFFKIVFNGDIFVIFIGKDGRCDDIGYDFEWNWKSGKLYWCGLVIGLQYNKKVGVKWC